MTGTKDTATSNRVFHSTDEGLIIEITDEVQLYRSTNSKTVPGKAALANDISIYLHDFLRSHGIATHLIERAGLVEQSVVETSPILFDVLISNVVTDDLVADFGLETGVRFANSLVELFLRPEHLNGEPVRISESHVLAFGLIDGAGLDLLLRQAMRINDLLCGLFFGIGVELEATRLEFGVNEHSDQGDPVLTLTSELSPDTLHLRDIVKRVTLDSRRAFDNDGSELSGYQEIVRRLDLDSAKALLSR